MYILLIWIKNKQTQIYMINYRIHCLTKNKNKLNYFSILQWLTFAAFESW